MSATAAGSAAASGAQPSARRRRGRTMARRVMETMIRVSNRAAISPTPSTQPADLNADHMTKVLG